MQFAEGRFHFRTGMVVADALRDPDAGGEDLFRFLGASQAGQQLSQLLVAGDVVRMLGEQFAEVFDGGVVVTALRAFERQAVARECVVGMGGGELFEHLAPRFLRLGHGGETAYYIRLPARHQQSRRRNRIVARAGKRVRVSRVEMVEVVLPQDANVLGNILGGRVMHLVDIAAAIVAHRHSNSHVVTASVDYVDFRNPIRVGELIILKASINRAFHTSMEIGVKVFSENVLTGERKHTTSAYVTFVAIDEAGQPKPVRPLILETPEERRRFREALARRRVRLALRYKRARRQRA